MRRTTIPLLSLVLAMLAGPAPADDADQGEQIRMRGIGWLVLRSHDPKNLAEFYYALGFKEWASSERIIGLHAGGGAALEIGRLDSGAESNPTISSRTQSRSGVIFGTTDVERVAENARRAGAMFVERYVSGPETLYYIGDPEGNVIGFAEDGPMWGSTEELERLGIEPVNSLSSVNSDLNCACDSETTQD